MLSLAVKILLAYLLGGAMGGDLMRLLLGGVDLRGSGSGNVGTTNALRTRGRGFALGVLLVDAGKGVLAVLLIPMLPPPAPSWLPYACGVAVALGHCYPLFHHFHGGKGVATLAGVFAVLLPPIFLLMLAVFALAVLFTGYVSLGSVLAALTALLAAAATPQPLPATLAFTVAMALLVLFKHRVNLVRLRAGSESRFERARLLGRLFDRRRH